MERELERAKDLILGLKAFVPPEKQFDLETAVLLITHTMMVMPEPKVNLPQQDAIQQFKNAVNENFKLLQRCDKEETEGILRPIADLLQEVHLHELADLVRRTFREKGDFRSEARKWQLIRYMVEVRLDCGLINLPHVDDLFTGYNVDFRRGNE